MRKCYHLLDATSEAEACIIGEGQCVVCPKLWDAGEQPASSHGMKSGCCRHGRKFSRLALGRGKRKSRAATALDLHATDSGRSRAPSSRRCREATSCQSRARFTARSAPSASALTVRARAVRRRRFVVLVEDLSIGWRSGKSARHRRERAGLRGRAHAVQARPRHVALGRRRGGRQPRRLLDQRAQGVRVCRDRPLQAWPSQGRRRFIWTRTNFRKARRGTRLWGANYEYALGEDSTFGATYMKFFADRPSGPTVTG